ncbi:MAG: class I adenylate-forming enzyme family protein [Nannocystaceae bacterium]
MLDLSRTSSLGEALRDATTTFKSREGLIEVDRHRESVRYSFSEIRRLAEGLGAALQGRGFAPGDRCVILMQNQAKWPISATAALWAGAVLVPLDYKLTTPEQLALLAHARPRALVTEYSTWEKLRDDGDPALFERCLVIVTDAPEEASIAPALRWAPGDPAAFTYRPRERDDVACIVYSSGTGGTPKGCMLTHHNYLEQAQVLGQMYPMAEGDRYFSILPTNHAIDFMCGFLLPFMMGGAVVHQRTLRPAFIAATMHRFQVTHIALVPTILKNLEKKLREKLDDLPKWQRLIVDGLLDLNEVATRRAPNHALSSKLLRPLHETFGGKLRLIFAGGAFVERSVAEFFNRIGIPVAIGYGLTEAGTVLTVNDLKPFRGDSVGRPVKGIEIEIRDANERGVGEVWARGPTIFMGYFEAPELTEAAIVDGWLRTGDLGLLDAAGHLKLLGRAKNMIVTEGGKNVYPEDIEALLGEIDGAEEIAVMAANFIWPRSTMVGEQLVLVLRPKNERSEHRHKGDDPLGDAVASLRRQNRSLADFKRLAGYVVWEHEFPRTASQKLKREILAREIRDRLDRKRGVQEL